MENGRSHNIRQLLTARNAIYVLALAGWIIAGALLLTHRPVQQVVVQPKESAITAAEQAPDIEFVNKIRAEHGLAALTEDPRLSVSAKQKADDLVMQQYWDHTTPQGRPFFGVIYAQIPTLRHSGENLGKCYDSEPAVFDAFVKSPSHLANIIDPGFSIFGSTHEWDNTRHCLIWVDHFGGY